MIAPFDRARPVSAFQGFAPALFDFYDGLAAHQERAWFEAHRADYERQVRAPLAAFVDSLALAFAARDIPLTGDPKRSLFRIHRDVRFSKDKRPYKTNASAILSRDGSKTTNGVFYFHIGGPEREVFMAQGFYAPEPQHLATLRRAIAAKPDAWRVLEEGLAAAGLSLSRDGALSRLPKGFEAHAGAPVAEVLKLRSLVVSRSLDVERIYSPALIDDAVAFARAGLSLLEFGWRALRA